MFIEVITTERNNPNKILQRQTINYYRAQSRAWLAKHCWWAMHEGLAVHTAAVVKED